MENASKALLIAGAILIVILIIAIGMIVYNSSKGTIDEAVSQMSSQEVTMYNNQFTTYEGDRVNGSTVRSLLDIIQTNNSKNNGIGAKTVKIKFTDSTISGASNVTNISTARGHVVTSKFYSVHCTDDTPKDGLMSLVTIVAK